MGMGFALRIANAVDCLFTVLLYLRVGNVELNPLLGPLLAFSWPLFVVVKLVGVAALSYALRNHRRVTLALTVLFVIAAASNAALWGMA